MCVLHVPCRTNLHTHGLRVDPGAVDISDICQLQAQQNNPAITPEAYYCNDPSVEDKQASECII